MPFAAAVEAGTAAVMTSHIVVPALDPDRPATLSPRVLGLLRDRLGFDGVIVSDALDMAGASAGRGIPEAAVLSLAAGCDLLCLGPDTAAALVQAVQDAIVAAVADGRLTRERLAEAAARVARCAARAAPTTEPPTPRRQPGAAAAARSSRASCPTWPARSWSASTPPPTSPSVRCRGASRRTSASTPLRWRTGFRRSPGRPLVLQVRDAHRRPEVLASSALAAAGRRAVVVEWGWPAYDVGLARISTRGSSAPGVAAVTSC